MPGLKKIIALMCYYSGLIALANALSRKKMIILLYHTVDKDRFREQMEYVKQKYHVIALEHAVARIRNEQIQGNEIVLTFDDGYENNYTQAYPVLDRLQIPATIFMASGLVGRHRFAWYDQVKEFINDHLMDKITIEIENEQHVFNLSNERARKKSATMLKEILKHVKNRERERIMKELHVKRRPDATQRFLNWEQAKSMKDWVKFGSHTVTHPILSECSDARKEKEINESKTELKKHLKTEIMGFCYPNGDYDAKTRELVTRAGYKYACGTKIAYCRDCDPYTLNRIWIDIEDSLVEFKLKLSPIWQVLK